MKLVVNHPTYGEIVYDENIWNGKKTLQVNGVNCYIVNRTAVHSLVKIPRGAVRVVDTMLPRKGNILDFAQLLFIQNAFHRLRRRLIAQIEHTHQLHAVFFCKRL